VAPLLHAKFKPRAATSGWPPGWAPSRWHEARTASHHRTDQAHEPQSFRTKLNSHHATIA